MRKEYIERGALLELETFLQDADGFECSAVLSVDIRSAKAADVVEVKHGRWIPTGMSNSTGPIVRCSVCGQYINPSATAIELNRQKIEPAFCEKCGAKMDGETE